MKELDTLIGLKWGEVDCLSLAIKAQAVLFHRQLHIEEPMNWCEADIQERSEVIAQFIDKYAEQITAPEEGAVALIRSLGYVHLATFIDKCHILTIRKNGKSEVVRYTEPFKRLTKQIYRWR